MIKILYHLVLFLMLTGCHTTRPTGGIRTNESQKYFIAYNVLQNQQADDYEVYVMDAKDGSDNQNITNHKDVAWTYYAWKNRLFFISDRDSCRRCYLLYETDASGKNIRQISKLRLEDSWMGSRQDGREMVVSGRIGMDIRYQLFIVNTATGAYRQITKDTAAMFRDPIFSPDGKKIVCAYQKNKRDRQAHEELWIMNADGSEMRQLTQYPPDDPMHDGHGYKAGPPHWNHQQNFISYQSEQGGKSSLFAVSPDGKKHWKLTANPQDEGWHDWSSDGRLLAVEIFDPQQKRYDIYLMDYLTKEMKRLTGDAFQYNQAPVFVEKK